MHEHQVPVSRAQERGEQLVLAQGAPRAGFGRAEEDVRHGKLSPSVLQETRCHHGPPRGKRHTLRPHPCPYPLASAEQINPLALVPVHIQPASAEQIG